MTSGGVTLTIPLAQLPTGPGGLTGGATLVYNSKYWKSMSVVQSVAYHHLEGDSGGGWWMRFGYVLEPVYPEIASISDPCATAADGLVQLRLIEPDGSEHMLYRKGAPVLPAGCDPVNNRVSSIDVSQQQVWYTLDGSFLRLVIEGGSALRWPNNNWTLYKPNGSRVELENMPAGTQETRLIDRNGNRLVWSKETLNEGGTDWQVDKLSDDYGHSIRIIDFSDRYEVRQQGNGYELRSKVQISYESFAGLLYQANTQGTATNSSFGNIPLFVSSVTMPRPYQNGTEVAGTYAQPFQFAYNARYHEISQMTMPSGAVVNYTWELDSNPSTVLYYRILANGLTQKSVTYKTGVGNTEPRTEVTTYNFPSSLGSRMSSSATAPDGGTTQYAFYSVNYRDGGGQYSGKIQKVTKPDGSVSVSKWTNNAQFGSLSTTHIRSNQYVSWSFESAVGGTNLLKTKKFFVDRNGNQTAVEERDWTSWDGVNEPAAPEVGTLLRRAETPMVSPTGAASTLPPGAAEANGYIELMSSRVLSLPQYRIIRDAASALIESHGYTYDTVAKGNVTTDSLLDLRPGLDVGRNWTYLYDTKGRVETATDPDLRSTTYAYNNCSGFGLSAKTVPSVGTTSYVMDCTTGLLTSMTNTQQRTDSFNYDVWGRLTERSEGSLRKTKYAYNDQALWILERQDANAFGDGAAVTVVYEDQLGRERRKRTLETVVASDTTAADESGSQAVFVDTKYVIDATRSAMKVSNPYRTSQSDGALGWTVTLTDRMGRTCAVENYSGGSEPTPGTCTSAGSGHGGRTALSYSTNSSGVTVTETIQGTPVQTRVQLLDGLGRLAAVTEDAGGSNPPTTSYAYDPAGRLKGVTQGTQSRSFTYSTTGWLLTAANPESGTTTYDYTASGQLLKKIDAKSGILCMGTLSGTSCTASYDGAGRPLKKSYSDGTPTVTYEYDRGWLWKVNNSVAAVTYGYDLLDRATSRMQTVSSVSYQHTATYKPAGLWTQTYHSGRVITYGRDAVGRVTGVSGVKSGQARTYLSSASYAPHGAPSTLSFGNSQTETWSWNYRLQPASIARGSALSLTYYYCPSQGTVCATNNGSMVSQTIGHVGVAQTYGYDAFGRLTSVSEGSGWSRSYGYDRYGNQWVSASPGLTPSSFTPQSQSWINAANNRLTNASLPIQHDNAGQMTKIGGLDWEYDGEGKIKKSTLNSIVTTMSYDGEGKRVKKQTGTRTTTMVYGVSGQLVEEYDTAPATETDVRYLAADHLGSTRMVFNQSGTATACLDYVPFGEQIPQGMSGRSGACWATADEPRQKFTGKERDSETGLDYFLARYYSPAQGRFTSPDEITGGIVDSFTGQPVGALGPLPYADIADPQTINKYAYVRNNPLRYTDPDGHLAAEPCKTGQGHCTPSPSPGSQIAKGSGKILLGVGLVATAAVGDIPGGVAGVVILTSAVYGGTVTAVSGVNDIHGATAKKDVTRAENTLEAIGNFGGLAATAATGSEETGKTVTTLTDIATLAMKPKDATRNVATMGEATKTVVNAANLLMDSWGSIKSTVSGLFAPKSVQPPRPPAPAPPVRLR